MIKRCQNFTMAQKRIIDYVLVWKILCDVCITSQRRGLQLHESKQQFSNNKISCEVRGKLSLNAAVNEGKRIFGTTHSVNRHYIKYQSLVYSSTLRYLHISFIVEREVCGTSRR